MEPQNTNANVNKPDAPDPAPLSRRDFLRHAGKEAGKAAQTGVKLVPGAALAQTVLGVGKDDKTGDGAGQIVGSSPAWWRRLVMWRGERTQGGGGG